MGLDVYFRRDICAALRAQRHTVEETARQMIKICSPTMTPEQYRLVDTYLSGARVALAGVAETFLIPVVQPKLVEGTLRREADVGFTTCWRGHRIRVRRIARLRVVAAR